MKHENEIAKIVVDICYKIHYRYGAGLLESLYEKILMYELTRAGLSVEVQKPICIWHDELFIPMAFRAGLIVDNCVLVELKSVEEIPKVAFKQVITYLRLTNLRLGILVNFNVDLIKNGIHRIINSQS